MGIIFWYSYKHLQKCTTATHNQYNFLIRRGHTPNHINDSAHDDNENIACQKNIGASQHLFICVQHAIPFLQNYHFIEITLIQGRTGRVVHTPYCSVNSRVACKRCSISD